MPLHHHPHQPPSHIWCRRGCGLSMPHSERDTWEIEIRRLRNLSANSWPFPASSWCYPPRESLGPSLCGQQPQHLPLIAPGVWSLLSLWSLLPKVSLLQTLPLGHSHSEFLDLQSFNFAGICVLYIPCNFFRWTGLNPTSRIDDAVSERVVSK